MALRLNNQRLLCISFNQDGTCLCLSDLLGVRIFNVESHTQVWGADIGAISVAQMLYCTSLLAFVGAGEQPMLTPRKLTLFNTHNNGIIQNISFPSSVIAVLLNRKRIVAILERRAFVYNLESLELLCTLDTYANPKGVGALTSCSAPSLLALPAPTGAGAVRVYDTLRGEGAEALCEIPAHKSQLGLLAWNADGSLLASASTKGTVVRVHGITSAATTHALRRGTSAATICSLAFSPPAASPSVQQEPQVLCVASDHSTVHVFQLAPPQRHRAAAAAASLLASVMPSSVAQVVEPARPLLTVRLPVSGVPCICAVQPSASEAAGEGGGTREAEEEGAAGADWLTLAVASGEGVLYRYRLEGLSQGGTPKYFLQGEWQLISSPSH